ncbi:MULTISPECIES: phage tail protein [Acinetobacter]|uniref:Phage minor tail protein n=2 Tax=Acinetobacter TaxID=469 RepID=N8UXJ2_9GAMM|nr:MULTISPECIES: phage tail protein [Acinetobacter]ENU92105.1 hypothetical protein F971_01992 [Acinetobacter vivianii]ENW92745.1 hypothetical protein F904_02688 [Acinetobacter dispersus]
MSDFIFTWECDLEGNSQTQHFKTLNTSFGDGYEQSTSVGINNIKGEWKYQRTAYKSEILAIKAFFDKHKGSESFLWNSPLDGQVRVKTDATYSPVQLGGDVWRISTTFKQVYHP